MKHITTHGRLFGGGTAVAKQRPPKFAPSTSLGTSKIVRETALVRRAAELLASADIRIGGDRPWDLAVRDSRLFARVFAQGSLGLGESYVDGWWDCPALDEFFYRVLMANLDEAVSSPGDWVRALLAKLANPQRPSRAFEIGRRHYDLGNDLFARMLGDSMAYSCGYWRDASTLDDAQYAKIDLVCRKLGLNPGMRVLDIGCGWGTALRHAATRYGVEAVGITVSQEQAHYAEDLCRGLPITIVLQDYRKLEGTFDRVFSVGMFEHVGHKNHRTFMEVLRRCLHNEGLALLHTIGNNRSVTHPDPWIERYIFPNSAIPSAAQLTQAAEGMFVIEDWHNFGADYDRTLLCWFRNFDAAWDDLKRAYDERFYRMWKYYLLSCAATFRARKNQLWQIVLSPNGVRGGYRAPR